MNIRERTNNRIQVLPSRLAMGQWCYQTNKQIGEGDIHAAYSADTIAEHGRIRRPFRLNGGLYTTSSISGTVGDLRVTAYQLICRSHFDGSPKRYCDICQSPRGKLGFYHGLSVNFRGDELVLIGPPAEIRQSDEAESFQPSLF